MLIEAKEKGITASELKHKWAEVNNLDNHADSRMSFGATGASYKCLYKLGNDGFAIMVGDRFYAKPYAPIPTNCHLTWTPFTPDTTPEVGQTDSSWGQRVSERISAYSSFPCTSTSSWTKHLVNLVFGR